MGSNNNLSILSSEQQRGNDDEVDDDNADVRLALTRLYVDWLPVVFTYRHLVGFCLALRENANNLIIKFCSDLLLSLQRVL